MTDALDDQFDGQFDGQLDDELRAQRLLASTRREFSPDAHTARRVFAATEVALHAGPVAPSGTDGGGALDVLWHAPGLSTRLWSAVALVAGAGVLGYGLGHEASVPAAPQPGVETPADSVMTQPTVISSTPAAPRAPTSAAPSAMPTPAPTQAAVAQPTGSPPRRSRQAPAADTRDALQCEIEAVRQMEAALRGDNPSRALSLLATLDEDIPQGQLREERRAGYAIAQCTLGLGDGAALLERFAREFPGSAYEPRVRARCGREHQ